MEVRVICNNCGHEEKRNIGKPCSKCNMGGGDE